MSSERANSLREAAASRSSGAAERARRALLELDRRGDTITFAVVAARGSACGALDFPDAAVRDREFLAQRHSLFAQSFVLVECRAQPMADRLVACALSHR